MATKKQQQATRAAQNAIQKANEAIAAGNTEAARNYINAATVTAGNSRNFAVGRALEETAMRLANTTGQPVWGGQFAAGESTGSTEGTPAGGPSGAGGPAPQEPGEDPFVAEQRRQNRISAVAYLRGLLDQYGLGELAGSVESLVDQYQSNVNAIAEGLRQTQPYKDRFKGLIALREKGITDVANEGQYLDLETSYRRAFQDAGLGNYIGTPGSRSERDAIADLVGKYSVSVDEVKTRIADAARVVNSTAREVKDAFRDFYGAADNDIIAMSLMPERATAEINRRANAATLAGIARQSGLNVGSGAAERVAGLSGDGDMSMDFALKTAADTRQVADATQRLANIEQSILSDDETLLSTTGIDEGARRKVRGLQSRERGRFGGTSAFGTGSLSTATGV